MQHMDIEAWMQRTTGGDSLRAIAKHIDVSPSTISRYVERNNTLSPEHVIKISRAYGASVVDALVDTGHLMEHEADLAGVSTALGHATNEQILDEMMRRVDPQAVRLFQGDEDTITPNFSGNVHQLNPPVSTPSAHDGTVTDWDDSQPFAADSSPDEGGTPDDYIP